MAVSGDLSDKAGFIVPWDGTIEFGDGAHHEYEITFDVVNNVREGRFGFLSIMAKRVTWDNNEVFVNNVKVGNLHPYDNEGWPVDTFCVPVGAVKKGVNSLKIVS